MFKNNIFKKNLELNPFIIAEVGQNHQGNFEIAKKYIEEFSKLGASAIKFQTRNNKSLFHKSAFDKEYNSENSFAKTYGLHREKLELSKLDLIKLRKVCKKNNVFFISTPFDKDSLTLLQKVKVDMIKIASFDLGNLSLIKEVIKSKIPFIISTGGGNNNVIEHTMSFIKKFTNNFSILHCVSKYPCSFNDLNLSKITYLKKKYPNIIIGLSDHFNGTLSGPIAYKYGARIFEKHVTFSRAWKGSDHAFSLEPNGFKNFVRDIKRVPHMHKSINKNLGRENVFKKLGKSIIASRNISKGKTINLNDLDGMIFEENYFPIRNSYKLIGKKTKKNLNKGDPITMIDIDWNA